MTQPRTTRPKLLKETFFTFPFFASLLIVIMMALVVLLSPTCIQQTLGFTLQNEEAEFSDVMDWQNVPVAGGAAQLRLPLALQKNFTVDVAPLLTPLGRTESTELSSTNLHPLRRAS